MPRGKESERVPTTMQTAGSFVGRVEKDGRIRRIVRQAPEDAQPDIMQAVRIALLRAKRNHDPKYGVSKRNYAVACATGAAKKAQERDVSPAGEVLTDGDGFEELIRQRIIDPMRDQQTPEQVMEVSQLRRLVSQAVRALDNENQQECIIAWLQGEPWAETAARLGIREDTCRRLKSEGLKRLRRLLYDRE